MFKFKSIAHLNDNHNELTFVWTGPVCEKLPTDWQDHAMTAYQVWHFNHNDVLKLGAGVITVTSSFKPGKYQNEVVLDVFVLNRWVVTYDIDQVDFEALSKHTADSED